MSNKIGNSLKWSTAGEVISKLIAPVTNMILARVLDPADFGILATVNMIITFVDLFTDSGFAKYIIQSDFDEGDDIFQYVNVAFWTNLLLSIVLWLLIYFFRVPIANMVGSRGHEKVIVIASIQLILTSFSSIQTALYRRFFDFKSLFIVRIIISFVPILITVPLSFVIRNYWSLVIGSIVQQVVNALYLSLKSKWKPGLYYDFKKLRKMFSFSIWSLMEALAYWGTTWFDVFIIGVAFSTYYLGIYKNSLNMVNSLMQIVKASFIPVLFSTLSRLKNREGEFIHTYDVLQEAAAIIIIPLGIGIYLFRDVATLVLFGNKWLESSMIIGVWALSSSFFAVFVNFYGEALKSKGLPKILFLYEVVCLIFMVPICLIAKRYGFWVFVFSRSAVVVGQIIIGALFMKRYIKYPIIHMINNVFPATVCSCIMAIVGMLLVRAFPNGLGFQFVCIAICGFTYLLMMRLLFKEKLKEVFDILRGNDPCAL